MKLIVIKYFLVSLLFMVILTYALGWIDIVENEMLTGNWLKDIFKSFSYYVGWILPFWWLIILVSSVILSLIGIGVKYGLNLLRG